MGLVATEMERIKFFSGMTRAWQMATPGPKNADKPKDGGLMVDFYLKGAVDFAARRPGALVRGL